MPKLKTEQLQEGMVVATEVRNMDNMLLLPTGCTLSQKHIHILEAWGITEVEIQGAGGAPEPADPLAALAPADLERVTEQTKALFWELDLANPVQAAIFHAVLRRRARKGAHA